MEITKAHNVYQVLCTEDEWYKVTEDARKTICETAKICAERHGLQYVNIVVKPDELFSEMGVAKRKQVFKHTFPASLEKEFERYLLRLANTYIGPGKLTRVKAMAIAARVFE